MREVRTCDFCGDDATGAFEPYPPSVPDGPRLLLCDGCRDRLASIVEPLVARIDDGAAAARERSLSSPDPEQSSATPDPEPAPSTPDPGRDEEAADRSTSDPVEGGSAAADDRQVVGDSTDAGGRSTAERAGTPPNYRKVMRFLENRELPIERDEAEHLVAEAYDLEEDAVAGAIDHAISYGRLREVSGQLKR